MKKWLAMMTLAFVLYLAGVWYMSQPVITIGVLGIVFCATVAAVSGTTSNDIEGG